jgi:hypothetical protein
MRFGKGRRSPQTSDLKEQLHLRMERTSDRIFMKAIKLKMVTRIVRYAIWPDILEGSATGREKGGAADSVRAGIVVAPATLGRNIRKMERK